MSDRHEDPGIHLRSIPEGTFASSEGLRRENERLRYALFQAVARLECIGRDTQGAWESPATIELGRAALRGTTP